MALAETIDLKTDHDGQATYPGSMSAAWRTVADSGQPASQDGSGTINNPDTAITGANNRIFRRQRERGTILRIRAGYDDGLTGITDPVINVFGRKDENDSWQRLPNLDGDTDVTLETATDDVEDGTLKYTTAKRTTHSFDTDGCNEFLIGTKTALAGTGTTSNSVYQVKIV